MATSDIPLLSYSQMKVQVPLSLRKPNPIECGRYDIYNDGVFFTVVRMEPRLSKVENSNGWKIHVSLSTDPLNLEKGWEIFARLAQKYNIGSFKIINQSKMNPEKQITIYCDGEEKENLQAFLIELNKELRMKDIVPDSSKSPDCKKISPYIVIRNEYFPLDGNVIFPPGYISDMHIDIAKKVKYKIENSTASFDEAFQEVINDQEFGGIKYRGTLARLNNERLKAEFEEKFKASIQQIVEVTRTLTGKIPWYNLTGRTDDFGLDSKDFSRKLSGQEYRPSSTPLFDSRRGGAPKDKSGPQRPRRHSI